ncbi:uncharacterized protein LOC142492522 isoform X3 [Ascaphus truei]
MPRRAYNLNWFMRSRDIEGLVHSSWTRRGISGETRRRRQSFQDEDIWEKPVCDWTVQDVCYWFQSGPLQEVAGLVQAAYTHDISVSPLRTGSAEADGRSAAEDGDSSGGASANDRAGGAAAETATGTSTAEPHHGGYCESLFYFDIVVNPGKFPRLRLSLHFCSDHRMTGECLGSSVTRGDLPPRS